VISNLFLVCHVIYLASWKNGEGMASSVNTNCCRTQVENELSICSFIQTSRFERTEFGPE